MLHISMQVMPQYHHLQNTVSSKLPYLHGESMSRQQSASGTHHNYNEGKMSSIRDSARKKKQDQPNEYFPSWREPDRMFPLKPVLHKREFSLSNVPKPDSYSTDQAAIRHQQRSGRKLDPLNQHLTSSNGDHQTSGKASRLSKEIQPTEMMLLQKILKLEETVRRAQKERHKNYFEKLKEDMLYSNPYSGCFEGSDRKDKWEEFGEKQRKSEEYECTAKDRHRRMGTLDREGEDLGNVRQLNSSESSRRNKSYLKQNLRGDKNGEEVLRHLNTKSAEGNARLHDHVRRRTGTLDSEEEDLGDGRQLNSSESLRRDRSYLKQNRKWDKDNEDVLRHRNMKSEERDARLHDRVRKRIGMHLDREEEDLGNVRQLNSSDSLRRDKSCLKQTLKGDKDDEEVLRRGNTKSAEGNARLHDHVRRRMGTLDSEEEDLGESLRRDRSYFKQNRKGDKYDEDVSRRVNMKSEEGYARLHDHVRRRMGNLDREKEDLANVRQLNSSESLRKDRSYLKQNRNKGDKDDEEVSRRVNMKSEQGSARLQDHVRRRMGTHLEREEEEWHDDRQPNSSESMRRDRAYLKQNRKGDRDDEEVLRRVNTKIEEGNARLDDHVRRRIGMHLDQEEEDLHDVRQPNSSESMRRDRSHLKENRRDKHNEEVSRPQNIKNEEGNARSEYVADAMHQLVPCNMCKRRFAQERLETHMRVCEKIKPQRNVYDMSHYRYKGTDNEKYMKAKVRRESELNAAKNQKESKRGQNIKSRPAPPKQQQSAPRRRTAQ